MKLRRIPHRAAVLQLLAVLASICLVSFGLVAFAVYRTVTVGPDVRAARNVVLDDAHLHFARRIEVTAHPLLVSAARFGISFAHLKPEARLAIDSVRGAEVGVYELTSTPTVNQRWTLLNTVNQRLQKRGWERTVAVNDRDNIVMVYTPREEMNPDRIEAFVMVLNDRDLVLVSGKGNLQPIAELVSEKMAHHRLGPLFAGLK